MITLRPERLVAGGDALARLDDGRIAFVPGALPGEAVEVEIVDDRRDFVRTSLVSVTSASDDRIEPPCRHRLAGCGGCGWMHLDPSAQLDAKTAIVAESLRRVGRLDESVIEQIVSPRAASDAVGRRTTIRVVGAAHGLGFREEGSEVVVPVTDCLVAHPTLSAVLGEVSVAPGVELTLRTSVSTGAVTALWERPRRPKRRRGAPAAARDQRTDPSHPVEGLPRSVHIGPRAFLTERVAGVDLRVSAPSFFQSGHEAATLLVEAVADAAPELVGARHVLDAYGGVGLFAATVARSAGHVTVVESSRSAVADARVNLDARGEAATIVPSEFGRWEPSGAHAPPIGVPDRPSIDVAIADPARSGLGRPGVAGIARAAAPVVVLVSCDPVSCARDAVLLGELGYRPERVDVLDLFPHTPHVETVTRFTR